MSGDQNPYASPSEVNPYASPADATTADDPEFAERQVRFVVQTLRFFGWLGIVGYGVAALICLTATTQAALVDKSVTRQEAIEGGIQTLIGCLVMIGFSYLYLRIAKGLLRVERWALIGARIIFALWLFYFPIGTAISGWCLVKLYRHYNRFAAGRKPHAGPAPSESTSETN